MNIWKVSFDVSIVLSKSMHSVSTISVLTTLYPESSTSILLMYHSCTLTDQGIMHNVFASLDSADDMVPGGLKSYYSFFIYVKIVHLSAWRCVFC